MFARLYIFALIAALFACVSAAPIASNEVPVVVPSQLIDEDLPELAKRGGQYSGRATWYTQNGVAGSCGSKNKDSAYIVALPPSFKGKCGKKVTITNTSNKKSVTATVADTCPGCGGSSLDMSTGAFKAIGNMNAGVLPISWKFNN